VVLTPELSPYGPRKGHKKGKKVVRATTANLSVLTPERTPAGEALLEHLETLDDKSECHKQLVNYVVENVHRMDYVMYRASGLQIGSGAHGIAASNRQPGATEASRRPLAPRDP
jgi:hypothetical protein